jgi:serine/threonine protein phosphatase 1
MHIHYAIGDVHGRDDLLEALHARIVADRNGRYADKPATIVYVGDYIDRGLRSREVIDRVRQGLPGFETIALKGNHEDLMLACLTTGDLDVWGMWLGNGGEQTAASFGLTVDTPDDCDPIALAKALGGERLRWFDTLKLYHRTDEHLFVHAGIVPGRPLAQQHEKDLLWIRNAFLHSDVDHGCIVVHGHTPTEQPELKSNRIGVDTGPTWYGNLTAVVLGEPEGPRFITVSGEPGPGPAPDRFTSPE